MSLSNPPPPPLTQNVLSLLLSLLLVVVVVVVVVVLLLLLLLLLLILSSFNIMMIIIMWDRETRRNWPNDVMFCDHSITRNYTSTYLLKISIYRVQRLSLQAGRTL